MTKKEKISYIAGIWDGEGYFGIGKSKSSNGNICYYARMTTHMKQPEAIKFMCDFFNLPVKQGKIGGKNYFSCYINDTNKIKETIETLLPFLKVKKRSAEIVLKLVKDRLRHKLKPLFIDGRFKGTCSRGKPSQDYHASLYHALKQIQGYGSKQILKT